MLLKWRRRSCPNNTHDLRRWTKTFFWYQNIFHCSVCQRRRQADKTQVSRFPTLPLRSRSSSRSSQISPWVMLSTNFPFSQVRSSEGFTTVKLLCYYLLLFLVVLCCVVLGEIVLKTTIKRISRNSPLSSFLKITFVFSNFTSKSRKTEAIKLCAQLFFSLRSALVFHNFFDGPGNRKKEEQKNECKRFSLLCSFV